MCNAKTPPCWKTTSLYLHLHLSDAEFVEFCRRFDDMNLEVTKEGTIRMMTPSSDDVHN